LPPLQRGPTVAGKPFSSAGYLKQSSGPLAPFFQWQNQSCLP